MSTLEKRGIDYYGVLGIVKGASDIEIKDAYKLLSIKYNPIRNKCPDAKMLSLFTLVGEAYEVLSNPLRKCIYDQYGEAGLKKGVITVLGWNPPWQYHAAPYQTFKNFFGATNPYADIIYCTNKYVENMNPKSNEMKKKQPPIERELELTLEEIFFGTMKKIKIKRRAYDKEQVTTSMQEKILCVRIRPGTPEGTKIIYKNVGDEGPNIIPGDLIITTKDLPHTRFRREGVNLHLDVTLEIHRALAELTIELNTLDCRTIRFAITDFVEPGYKKIVDNEGMPYVDNNLKKGDLIITFDVKFPSYFTEAARKKIIEAIINSENPVDDSPEALEKLQAAQRLKMLKDFPGKGDEKELMKKPLCEDFIKINKDDLLKM